MEDGRRLTLVMIAEVAPEAVVAFRHYEARVLPLLARHHGQLVHCL